MAERKRQERQGKRMSTPDVQPADLMKLLEQWIATTFGLGGTITLALVVLLAGVWWNWEKISQLPGLASVLKARPEPPRPLPVAAGGMFAVAVAHIEGDEAGEQERLVLEALSDMPSIEVLRFDRLIKTSGDVMGTAEKNGHDAARTLLEQSKADVLIWGVVLRNGTARVPKLRWTTRLRVPVADRAGRYVPTEELNMPAVFGDDLAAILDLLVLTSDEYMDPTAAHMRTSSATFIDRIDRILTREASDWSSATRGQLYASFADVLLKEGIQNWRDKSIMRKAQVAYALVVNEHKRTPWSTNLPALLYKLAMTHFLLGARDPIDVQELHEAVGLYRVVAKGTWGRDPFLYARSKIEEGHCLRTLGETESNPELLRSAVTAYVDAAYETDKNSQPDQYREILFNRAEALRAIGIQGTGVVELEQALPPYRALLELYGSNDQDRLSEIAKKISETEALIDKRRAGDTSNLTSTN